MSGYFSVQNWTEFQHYKDRNPPWIKLHRDLLRDYDFACLQDASKLLLIELWLLASQLDNKIPNDPKWLNRQLPYDGKIDLKPLINTGFIILDSSALADCKQSAIVETETEAETYTEKEQTPAECFALFWDAYPKKVGKKPALTTWKRIKPDASMLIADIAKRLKEDRQWKSGYIPNPQTYLNQERWTDAIQEETPQSIKSKIPRDDSQLESFAVEKGLYKRGCAPQSIRNNYELRQWIQERV